MIKNYFEVSALPEGRSSSDFLWKPENLDLKYNNVDFPTDVLLHLNNIRRGLEITCFGTVSTIIETKCVRCLDVFPIELAEKIDFAVRLIAGAPINSQLWYEDIVRVDPASGKIDISPRVRDAVLLGVPTHPLCKPDCKGLCPICGANLNHGDCGHTKEKQEKQIDPRWEKLKQLLENKNQQGG
ncbi:DUF177 domain-containing protein [bacterium]|nr:MAG: DUF177 domain-containing protein [bacterium]